MATRWLEGRYRGRGRDAESSIKRHRQELEDERAKIDKQLDALRTVIALKERMNARYVTVEDSYHIRFVDASTGSMVRQRVDYRCEFQDDEIVDNQILRLHEPELVNC